MKRWLEQIVDIIFPGTAEEGLSWKTCLGLILTVVVVGLLFYFGLWDFVKEHLFRGI